MGNHIHRFLVCLVCTLCIIWSSVGCEKRPVKLDRATKRTIDTTAARKIKDLKIEMDSLCDLQFDDLVKSYMDSIRKVRIDEIIKLK